MTSGNLEIFGHMMTRRSLNAIDDAVSRQEKERQQSGKSFKLHMIN
jgi:hypothetical protein